MESDEGMRTLWRTASMKEKKLTLRMLLLLLRFCFKGTHPYKFPQSLNWGLLHIHVFISKFIGGKTSSKICVGTDSLDIKIFCPVHDGEEVTETGKSCKVWLHTWRTEVGQEIFANVEIYLDQIGSHIVNSFSPDLFAPATATPSPYF